MSFLLTSTKTIKLFFVHSNSPKDKKLWRDLEPHLSSLKLLGVGINWHRSQTLAGRDWKQESYQHLNTCEVIVLLVSPDFLAADDCKNMTRRAMERYNAGKASVIPVKLRPIDNWQATPFGHLQCLPDNGEPITSKFWRRQDDAFVNIVEKIREEVEKIQQEQRELQLIREQQKSEIFASINRFISNHFLNRIILGINVRIISVGIAASIIGVAVLLRFCSYSPEIPINNLLTQGQDKLDRRDYQGASEDYTQVIQIAPKNAVAYIQRGHAQYYIQKYQAAIDDYNTAIRLSPDSADTYEALGFVYDKNLRNQQQAIKNYQKAATLYEKQGVKDRVKRMRSRLKRLQQNPPRFAN
ncbi:tetratricopeptide repeat protein [Nostoc sp. CCY 9925]|uniref:tetratricopeptide repeat protein n=1 Tax=Nostoc sp. CCY 9925 TaxID=3103865 RepID=UPI0039C6E8D9